MRSASRDRRMTPVASLPAAVERQGAGRATQAVQPAMAYASGLPFGFHAAVYPAECHRQSPSTVSATSAASAMLDLAGSSDKHLRKRVREVDEPIVRPLARKAQPPHRMSIPAPPLAQPLRQTMALPLPPLLPLRLPLPHGHHLQTAVPLLVRAEHAMVHPSPDHRNAFTSAAESSSPVDVRTCAEQPLTKLVLPPDLQAHAQPIVECPFCQGLYIPKANGQMRKHKCVVPLSALPSAALIDKPSTMLMCETAVQSAEL